VTPTSEPLQELPHPPDKERLYEEENASADTTKPFLTALAEGRVAEPSVKAFLSMVDRFVQTHHLAFPIHFPQDHPVEEVGRSVGLSFCVFVSDCLSVFSFVCLVSSQCMTLSYPINEL
jgi:hypothetical protein